jgi:hypothetical protein
VHRHSRTFGDLVATNGLNGAFGQLPDPPSLFEGADRQNPAPAGFCFLGRGYDEPEILPSSTCPNLSHSADGGQSQRFKSFLLRS